MTSGFEEENQSEQVRNYDICMGTRPGISTRVSAQLSRLAPR